MHAAALLACRDAKSEFGSRLMTQGFILNNQLTDFSFQSHSDGVPVAHRVEPGKRPRSSMAPTIVFKNGTPRDGTRLAGWQPYHSLRR
jgi:gamma-glutamyltranspeptidase / glutathione hydrolase